MLSAPAPAPTSSFVFMLCQRGAEPALKREIARLRPDWHAAYQRPGLLTFKALTPVSAEHALDAIFPRAYGISLGTARDLDGIAALLAPLPRPLRLHVSEPDKFRPDEEPPSFVREAREAELARTLRAAIPDTFAEGFVAREGDWVCSVIAAPGDPWLVGLHRNTPARCPHPGGRFPIAVPPEAPSRAYAKIEEAIAAFGLPIRPGDVALEVGAAPGGAAYALLRRGVSVIGVDPGAVDPSVLSYVGPRGARFTHHPVPVAALSRDELPKHVDWLLFDVHLAPQVALRAARRLASWYRGELCGAVLTLKLNDWSFADAAASYLEQAREMGLPAPVIKQLASHRQEFAVVGLTERGKKRTPTASSG
jgi:23S rRNA (cytidine2498-2'-O)-methyltransferase